MLSSLSQSLVLLNKQERWQMRDGGEEKRVRVQHNLNFCARKTEEKVIHMKETKSEYKPETNFSIAVSSWIKWV